MRSGSSARPRPGGGFNAGMGQFGEHLDEAAMQQASQQKSLQQQGASTTKTPTLKPTTPAAQQSAVSRDMGSFTDELFKRPAQDFWEGIKSLADLNTWLGVDTSAEDAQERAHKEIILKNFNQLTDEEQVVAKQHYQARIKKLQAEAEEKERQKQLKTQEEQATLHMPASPKKGPIGPGMSGSQKAKAQVDWDRQRLSGPANVG